MLELKKCLVIEQNERNKVYLGRNIEPCNFHGAAGVFILGEIWIPAFTMVLQSCLFWKKLDPCNYHGAAGVFIM